MRKSIIAFLALSLLLPSAAAIAEESVIINTDTAIINVDDTIVINGETFVNGTVIRSINNSSKDIYFRPSLDDVGYIAEQVRKETGKGAVYTGEFDLNPVDQGYDNNRQYEILGRDIILKKEDYENGKYVYEEMSKHQVSRQNAIMALYKAIGDSEFQVKLFPKDTEDIPINDSPLLEVIKVPVGKVYGKGYYTDVFVTRTTPARYWNNALEDGVLFRGEDGNVRGESITVAQFAQYVATLLNVKGEPVLTDQEQELLLTTYGTDIPYYLPGPQLEAVKYLMARGILENGLQYKKNISRDEMITILMRAKDKSSRLTFKEVTIPYIESLVAGGYYPTQTEVSETPITNVSWDTGTVAVQESYDYFVRVAEDTDTDSVSTVFRNSQGAKTNNLYVSSSYNDVSSEPYPGSEYLGVEDGYYHFRIPISILNDPKAVSCIDPISGNELPEKSCWYDPEGTKGKAFITINSTNKYDTPGNIKLEFGGGLYLSAQPEHISSLPDHEKTLIMYRQAFTPDYSDRLIDRERKLVSQGDIKEPIMLASNNKAVLTFQTSFLDKLMWDGKPLKDSKVFAKTDTKDVYTITVDSPDPYREVMALLTTTGGASGDNSRPAYVKDGRTALVSLDYLKANEVVTSILPLSKGKCKDGRSECGTYVLYSKYSNVLIDTVNRLIVSGQSVTEIPDTDPSPLIIHDPHSGQYLVDARAVQAVGSELFVVKSESGSVSVSLNTDKKNAPGYKWTSIYPMLGDRTSNYIKSSAKSGKMRVYLEDTYPLSNFLIYRSRKASVNEDFLLVFKPKIDNVSAKVTEATKTQLRNRFHIELGDAEVVSVYTLSTNSTYQEVIKEAKTVKSDDYGYYLETTTIDKFNYSKYIKGTDTDFVLPIVQVKSGDFEKLLDLNVNTLSDTPMKFPSIMMNSAVRSWLNLGTDSFVFKNSGGWGKETYESLKGRELSLTAAPAGVQAKYFPFERLNWIDAPAKGAVYFGTMKSSVKIKTDQYSTFYYLATAGEAITSKIPMERVSADKPFTEIFRGSQNSIFVYDVAGKSRLLNFIETAESAETPSFVTTSGESNFFDWLAYRYKVSLSDADDLMTITILFLLSVIPRVMLFILIGFSTLVIVKDQRMIQRFCAKYVDIYKVASFGITNINAVSVRGIWVSGFFAIVLLSLMNSGLILEVAAWLTRAFQGILDR